MAYWLSHKALLILRFPQLSVPSLGHKLVACTQWLNDQGKGSFTLPPLCSLPLLPSILFVLSSSAWGYIFTHTFSNRLLFIWFRVMLFHTLNAGENWEGNGWDLCLTGKHTISQGALLWESTASEGIFCRIIKSHDWNLMPIKSY